jgi:hypothetical protein
VPCPSKVQVSAKKGDVSPVTATWACLTSLLGLDNSRPPMHHPCGLAATEGLPDGERRRTDLGSRRGQP